MSQATRQHEQIRNYIEARFPDAAAAFTDDDVEKLAAQPVVAHLAERDLRDVNMLLRTLPDDLLEHLRVLASVLSEWGNLEDFATMPTELVSLAVIPSDDKIRQDEVRFTFRTSIAVARLSSLVFVEVARRDGRYSFVEDYDLAREEWTAPILENYTGR